jgi:hypothetical protein
MTCCTLLAMFDPTDATMCTTVAQGNNQASCQSLLAMLPSELATYCQ